MAAIDNKPVQHTASKSTAEAAERSAFPNDTGTEPLNREQLQIANWLKTVRFRKQLFGGISEEDVWKKLEELNGMYEAALKAERVRYDVLLEQQGKGVQPVPPRGDSSKGRSQDG